VRIPAALNGVTGLKTTRGLISLHGAVALSTTLDTLGPLTRDTRDAMLLTALMAGPDAQDPLTLGSPAFRYREPASGAQPLRGARIALMPISQHPIAVEADALSALDDARRVLTALGAEVAETPFPFDFREMMQRNGLIIAAEAYAVHRGYIEDPAQPIGQYVRARVLSGKSVSAADYIAALQAHAQARQDWLDWMRDIDAVLTPCAPFGARHLDDVDEAGTPLAAFTRAGNYVNASGLALPAGFTANGLPLGVQLLGKPHAEGTLGRIGMAFQAVTDWHRQHPDLKAVGL
jgi:aspartyl-tRNA(Asn)/glutamyl-tRNA(Gln) amidotransferase subunit A